jgi:hypothetical protein
MFPIEVEFNLGVVRVLVLSINDEWHWLLSELVFWPCCQLLRIMFITWVNFLERLRVLIIFED